MKTSKIQHFLRSLILMIAILAISLTFIMLWAAAGVICVQSCCLKQRC